MKKRHSNNGLNNRYETKGLSSITLSYKIAIVATMSAGKSTLLNAILGTDLMPARNEACTAKIFQLDQHKQDHYELYQNNVGWVKTTASDIDQKNKASSDKLIRLRGDIYGLSSATNPHVQITIYDTPGPNNSMNQSHNDITKSFLQNYDYDMVIYVMNATQFGVNDDRYLLNDLKRMVDMPKKANIVFVLNKSDKIDIEKGESIKGLVSEAKKYLKNIGFVNPNVIPISAKATGLARKSKQNMPLTRAERNELTSYIEIIKEETLFDFINHIPSSIEEQYHREIRRISDYQHREENHQHRVLDAIIAQSGLLHLEAFLHAAINHSILLKNKTLIVELSYNPFLVETHIKVNSKELPKSNKLNNRMKHCLQHWIDDFFDELSKLYNHTSQIKVDFAGTEADFDDILASAEFFEQKNKSVHIELNHIKKSEASDTRLTKFKALIEEAKKGPIDALRGQDFHKYEKSLDPKFDVNVLATMSSGKSTLINSILGQEILPAKNEAYTTATIARIHNDKTMPQHQFSARRFNQKGNLITDWQVVDQQILNIWNSDSQTKNIEIKGNIPTISNIEHSALTIVDIPGPNNSKDPEHGKTTQAMLRDKEASMILYVMNATQLSTNDDKYFLTTVKEEIGKYGKEARDRFIFLVNKFDAFDPEMGEDPKNILVNVKQYIEKNGIVNPIIFPISARMTLLSRRSQSGLALTRVEKRDLSILQSFFIEEPAMHLLQYMNVSASVKKQAEALIAQAKESGNDAELASIYAGVPIVELVIQEYLQKYVLPINMKKTYKTMKLFLYKVNADLISELKKTQYEIEKNSQHIDVFNAKPREDAYKHNDDINKLVCDIVDLIKLKDKVLLNLQWINEFEKKLDDILVL